MAEKVKFYISESDSNWGTDIETEFSGMHYLSCKGLEDKGKVKNKYQESYADHDELRVYEPSTVNLEATDIVFTCVFSGEKRQQAYDSFYNKIKSGKWYYYDTLRYKKAYITLFEAVKPSDDIYKGSEPYIKAEFKFKNLWGQSVTMKH